MYIIISHCWFTEKKRVNTLRKWYVAFPYDKSLNLQKKKLQNFIHKSIYTFNIGIPNFLIIFLYVFKNKKCL